MTSPAKERITIEDYRPTTRCPICFAPKMETPMSLTPMIRYAKASAMFFIVFAVGFTIMSGIIGAVRAAHGEEAPGVRWLTVVTIETKDGHILKMGYPVSFKSKEECQANLKSDEKLLDGVIKMMEAAAQRGDKIKSIECTLDDSGEHV